MNLFASLALGVALFASTDIDDLFFLIAFFADPNFRRENVVAGQFLGIITLIGMSLAASLISLVLNPAYVGLLGVLPILMGVKKLSDLWRNTKGNEERGAAARGGSTAQIFAVFSVTIASGGDNLSAYIPLFATQSMTQTIPIVAAMLVMNAIWLEAAYWLTNHRTIGAPIRRYGPGLVPFVLTGVGIYVLYRAGSLSLFYPNPR